MDILSAAATPFDTGAGVLANFILGGSTTNGPNPYVNFSFDITALVGLGGTFQLRFAEVDNLGFLNMGVDNVSINARRLPAPRSPNRPPCCCSAQVSQELQQLANGAKLARAKKCSSLIRSMQ